MASAPPEPFLGNLHDCYFATDTRVNKDLASKLKGQNVVIAGAGRGIGRAAAELFSHGSLKSLSLVALEQDEVDETATICEKINSSTKYKARTFDVCDVKAVQNFLSDVEKNFGGIDVLVMNAGRPPQWLPTSEDALPVMQRQKSGRIIFTSSAGAHANQFIGSYIVGKLGMVRLAEIIHAENVDANIKAFAIHPGAIATRFFHDFKNKADGKTADLKYISADAEGEEKSARTAVNFFENVTWDTPYLAGGMMTVLASGDLDFMSGRYVDSAVRVEDFVSKKDTILKDDLYRVRLNAGDGELLPRLEF